MVPIGVAYLVRLQGVCVPMLVITNILRLGHIANVRLSSLVTFVVNYLITGNGVAHFCFGYPRAAIMSVPIVRVSKFVGPQNVCMPMDEVATILCGGNVSNVRTSSLIAIVMDYNASGDRVTFFCLCYPKVIKDYNILYCLSVIFIRVSKLVRS